MPGRLVHFEVPAKDTNRAKSFYSDVFGWTFNDSGMPGIDYNLTEAGGEPGGAVYTHEEMSEHIFVYFDADDIEGSIAKVRDAGGEANDKAPIPGIGWFARCKDSEGNPFSFFQSDDSVPHDAAG